VDLTVLLVLAILLALLAIGVHIGIALGLTGILGIWLTTGTNAATAQIANLPYSVTAVYSLAVVPLFILMGAFFSRAELTADLYRACYLWLSRIRGALPIATTLAAAGFGALTGSSVANAAVFARTALPEMVKHGVDKKLAAGCIAAAGTLAALIPPSLLLVFYGLVTNTSVAALLIAGIIPGALTAVIYMVGIYLRVLRKPELAPRLEITSPLKERLGSLKPLWGAGLVFLLVTGGIYLGWFTPTQSAAIGACGALLVALTRKKFRRSGLWGSLKEAAITTGTVLLILVGGNFFARFLSYSGTVRDVSQALLGWEQPAMVYLLIFIVVMFILGMFLEAYSSMVLVLPLMVPILLGAGFDPIWLGVITVKLTEIGLMSPPVGLNVFVVRSSSPIPMRLNDVFSGVFPFIGLEAVVIALLIAFPSLTLFLPSLMAT